MIETLVLNIEDQVQSEESLKQSKTILFRRLDVKF